MLSNRELSDALSNIAWTARVAVGLRSARVPMRVYSLGVGALVLLAVTSGNAYAGTCNLTVAGSTCTEGGALYTNILPVGTFYVDPFLQMKTSGGSTTEQGYNTTG